MRNLALAIDVGTSSVRAATFSEGLERRGYVQRRYKFRGRQGGTFPADDLAHELRAALTTLDTSNVSRVVVSSLWHSVLGVDAHDNPVTDVYTWESRIPASATDLLRGCLDAESYRSRTGSYIHSSYPLAAIALIRSLNAEVASYTDLPSWLLRATLGTSGQWSEQIAAGSGLWNQAERSWDAETCHVLRLDQELLGDTWRTPITLDSPEAGRLGLAGAELLPPLGDGYCDNLGVGAIGPRVAAIASGTSGAVRMVVEADAAAVPQGLWRYRLSENLAALGGANSNVGNLFEWTRAALGSSSPLSFVGAAPPDAAGLIAVPHLFGERGPHYRDSASAGVIGVGPHHTSADIARELLLAALGTTRRLWQLLIGLEPLLDQLVASGGMVTRSPEYAQLLADAVGRSVWVRDVPEASLRGAAAHAFGRVPDHTQSPGKIVRPREAWTSAIDERLRASEELAQVLDGRVEPFGVTQVDSPVSSS